MTHLNTLGLLKFYISFSLFLQKKLHSHSTLSLIDLDSPEYVIKTEYVIPSSHRKWIHLSIFFVGFCNLLWGNAQGCESRNTLHFGKNFTELRWWDSCGSVGQLLYNYYRDAPRLLPTYCQGVSSANPQGIGEPSPPREIAN